MCLDGAKLNRKDKVKTLETFRPGVKLANTTVHVDPAILSARLTAIFCGNENPSNYYEYSMHVQRHYWKYQQVNVVFDGYMEGSTKSQHHYGEEVKLLQILTSKMRQKCPSPGKYFCAIHKTSKVDSDIDGAS